jgi:hypothetical protein
LRAVSVYTKIRKDAKLKKKNIDTIIGGQSAGVYDVKSGIFQSFRKAESSKTQTDFNCDGQSEAHSIQTT